MKRLTQIIAGALGASQPQSLQIKSTIGHPVSPGRPSGVAEAKRAARKRRNRK